MPRTGLGADSFGQGPMRRAPARRRSQDRLGRANRRIAAPVPEDLPDAAPFLAQLLAQNAPEEAPADPFETASRAYEKVGEDPFEGIDEEALDGALIDPMMHVDVKI